MSRENLAASINHRAALNNQMEATQSALARLQSAQSAEAPIIAALAALDDSEARAFAAWSRSAVETPAPTPDVEERAALTKRLSEVRASADAARRAIPGLEAEYVAEAGRIAEAGLAVKAAAAAVLVDEVAALVGEYRAALATLAAVEARVREGKFAAIAASHDVNNNGAAADLAHPIFKKIEALNAALDDANPDANRVSGQRMAAATNWRLLLDRLARDAEAKIAA